ncbi:tyrosine-type recombinase/integrase [Brotaphodocola sp.]|uniref:tyrosine-type recombinase/integrase n=1 Tax=Brotaphodocola sp. TaxID=3073577 RepID=UPI003D7E8DBF
MYQKCIMKNENEEVASYEIYLKSRNLSQSTITSYLFAYKQFFERYSTLTVQNLRDYKVFLMDHYKPQTVNLRIRAINCYLEFLHKENWKLSSVRTQQKPFLENVISEADYLYFKNCLKQDNHLYWYFVVRFLTATGARISELLQIKAEHVQIGYLDLYSKGGKLRRIYIPSALQKEALDWMRQTGHASGFLFVNKYGKKMTARGIAGQLKHYAIQYGLDPAVIYPHSFRHRFAKSFLERYNDLSMLADLMGHESIETTRIYLRKTSTEQQAIVNQIVDW